MTISLKHLFQSAVPDDGDANLVQPSNWNAEHVLTLGTGKLVGRSTVGTGAAEEISIGSGLSISGGVLSLTGTISSLTTPVISGGTTASSTLTLQSTSGAGTTDALLFKTGSQVERMRITSNGFVGIGTSTPNSPYSLLNVKHSVGTSVFGLDYYDTGSGGNNIALWAYIENYNNDGYGDGYYGAYARGTKSSPLAVQAGDSLSYLGAGGWNGTTWNYPSQIEYKVDDTVSTNNVPTALLFRTGSNAAIERMRITSSGRVGIGTSSPNSLLSIVGNLTSGAPLYTNNIQLIAAADEYPQVEVRSYGSTDDAGGFMIYTAGGSPSSPSSRWPSHTYNGYLVWQTYNASNTGNIGTLASIDSIQTGAPTATGNVGALRFFTSDGTIQYGGIERMRIASDGFVGIGTGSPSSLLHINGGTSQDQLRLYQGVGFGYKIGRDTSDGLLYFSGEQSGANGYVFGGADGERMRIDTAGNVGIGTNAPNAKFQVDPSAASGSNFQVYSYDTGSGGSNTAVVVSEFSYNNDGFGDGFAALYARGTKASPLPVQSGDETGYFYSPGWTGTQTKATAWLGFKIDGAVSSTVIPQAIFFTTGSSSSSERMRITSAGNVGIGTSSPTQMLTVNGGVGYNAPVTITGATYVVTATDNWLIANYAGTVTLTLPAASSYTGRIINVKTVQAQTVVSNSSDVVPIGSTSAGTAILSATAGAFAKLVSDGTNWVVNEASQGSGSSTLTVGTTATSGGAAGQIMFDTGSVLQESSNLVWDNTNKKLTITGATVTTSQPVLDMTQTWNNAATTFTGLKFNVTNTASAAASLLLDLQENGSSIFSVKPASSANQSDLNLGNSTRKYIVFIGPSANTGVFYFYPGGAYNAGAALILNSNGASTPSTIDFLRNGFNLTARFDANGNLNLQSAGAYAFTSTSGGGGSQGTVDTYLTRRGAANLRFGAADAAAPVAQTLSVQSVVAGTSNTAGANLTITGSQGTGTGAGGSIIFQVAPAGSSGTAQNALTTAFTINSSGQVLRGSPTSTIISQNAGIIASGAIAATVPAFQITSEETTTNASTGGGSMAVVANPAAAMLSGSRLGAFAFGGSSSSSAIRYAATLQAFASQTWVDGSAYGSRYELATTANGSTIRTTRLIVGNSGIVTFGATEANTVPALKPSSTTLQARLADDSGYTTMDAQHRLQGTAPASATATGTAGDIRYDADYIYICTATNTWKRVAIATWP